MSELEKEIKIYTLMGVLMVRGIGGTTKNRCLWQIKGFSILHWVLSAAKRSKYLKRVIVATENDEIAVEAKSIGVSVIRRPLSSVIDYPRDYKEGKFRRLKPRSYIHNSPFGISHDYDWLLWSLLQEEGYSPDMVVQIDADYPFCTTSSLDKMIETFFADPESSCGVTIYRIDPKFYTINSTTGRLFPIFNDTVSLIDRQDYPPIYKKGPHCIIGLPTRQMRSGRTYTHYIVSKIEGQCVHSEYDLSIAQCMAEVLNKLPEGGEKVGEGSKNKKKENENG